MSWVRHVVFVVLVASAVSVLAQKNKEDWLPVAPEDLAVKEVPGNPGAAAIQLYYANFLDHVDHSEFSYVRIKVLNEKGKKFADVEIPFDEYIRIKDLKARTIHPDGTIVEYTGKPFEKTLIKGRGIKWLVKSFTLPDVSVGSIIEYKYKLRYDYVILSDIWVLQHDLYTVQEKFSFTPLPVGRVAWATRNMKSSDIKKVKDDSVTLEMHNVPAFESESYMPPERNYKPTVHFFYLDSEIKSSDKFWETVGKDMGEGIERFIGNHKEAREAAAEAIGDETDPEKKLRRLYARAQKIRNLSYERERSAEEIKKEKIKENEGVGEIFKRGYGDRWDVTRAFVAMARAAGFEASILKTSNRKDEFFNKEVLNVALLDNEIAYVKLNGQEIYLDPGTRYCPYGLVRWMRTSTTALKPDKKSPVFLTVPPAQNDKAVIRRKAVAVLGEDGSLKSEISVQFEGLDALEHRLNALDTDEAGRARDLEDEMRGSLPADAVVKLKDVKGWEEIESPLIATFSVELSGYSSTAGKRLLLPPYLFKVRQADAFNHPERKYPIYFSYSFTEVDVISIRLPAGVSAENIPQAQDVNLPYARYQNVSEFSGDTLVTKRALLMNGIYFAVGRFPEVKDFFNKVANGDEQQAVLCAGGGASAQKGN